MTAAGDDDDDRPGGVARPDATDRRDPVRDQGELDRARGRHQERRKDLLPGTRAWRTDHTEIMLVEPTGGESEEVCHAIEAHHNEIEPRSVEAHLVQAADAISASRSDQPRCRRMSRRDSPISRA